MQKLLRILRFFDFATATGCLGYGAWRLIAHAYDWTTALWLVSGVIGFGLAIYNPSARMQAYLARKLVRRPSERATLSTVVGLFPPPPKEPYFRDPRQI
jgi:hypothetical protein